MLGGGGEGLLWATIWGTREREGGLGKGNRGVGGGGGRGRTRAHFGSTNATAGTTDFGRRTATAAGQMSSSLLLLPSNL